MDYLPFLASASQTTPRIKSETPADNRTFALNPAPLNSPLKTPQKYCQTPDKLLSGHAIATLTMGDAMLCKRSPPKQQIPPINA